MKRDVEEAIQKGEIEKVDRPKVDDGETLAVPSGTAAAGHAQSRRRGRAAAATQARDASMPVAATAAARS